jgi:hypothetical protein
MKRIQIWGFALIIITLLVSLAFSNSVSSALITSNTTISSAGTVQYAGPPATNFADIPADWRIGETWNAPTYLDYNVLHNGHPSIRMEKGTDATKSREILAADKTQSDWCIRVKPGDHIVFTVWMKTSASTIGDTSRSAGIRLGIDFYTASGRINGIQSPDGSYWTPSGGWPPNEYLNYVNWGYNWTQRTMDFIIPNQYPSDEFGGYPAGQLVTPDRMIPWIQVWSSSHQNADDGIAWFADAELYINP